MESRSFAPAISLKESAHSSKSRELFSSPSIHVACLVPVSSRSIMTDFSINRILGLKSSETDQETTSTALTECRRDSSLAGRSCSDSRGCDSEPDRLPTQSEKKAKKKRQRTTFSMFEVWELERAYTRRPYLTPEDEEDLVKRLGITARSLRYWFQNRRAKSRKEEKKTPSDFHPNPSNQFEKPPQIPTQSPVNYWRQADRLSYPGLGICIEKLKANSRPITVDYGQSAIKPDQLSERSSFLGPMFHPDQFRRRPVALKRPVDNRGFYRYQTY